MNAEEAAAAGQGREKLDREVSAVAAPAADRQLLEEAVDLVRRAGELSLTWFGSRGLRIDRKGDGTPVTEADRAVERFLREQIADRHPGDGIAGEEESEKSGTSGRRWIIDPIDGTKAFTRAVPLYSNLLAVEDAEGIVVGVINVPAIGEMVWAGRGLGCFINGEPARVSRHPTLAGAYVSTSGYDTWADEPLLQTKQAGAQLRTWGDGYGYLLVATGRVDAMVDPEAASHDLAPMPVIIAEAGGRFTDVRGTEGAFRSGSGLATNGFIHSELLSALNQ
jgi:histidinol-phosphatase